MSYGAFPLHGTVRFVMALLGGFPLGTVLGTFFSTTSVEVPSKHFFFLNRHFVVCLGSTDVPLIDSRGADPARA